MYTQVGGWVGVATYLESGGVEGLCVGEVGLFARAGVHGRLPDLAWWVGGWVGG